MEHVDEALTLECHDLAAHSTGLAELRIGTDTTEQDANAAMRVLGDFNGCMLGLVRFSGETPWEKHEEDELLHVLEGEVRITILLDDGARVEGIARKGQVVIVPRGRWHRQHASVTTTLLFATGTTAISTAKDPR